RPSTCPIRSRRSVPSAEWPPRYPAARRPRSRGGTTKGAPHRGAAPPSGLDHDRSVASELLPQRGQGLVGGQGALGTRRRRAGRGGAALRAVGGGGGVVAGLRGSRVVGGSLLDLGPVGLPAGVGVGVLLLPGLALGLVALEPLVGLRVEALGVLVVALLVVLRGHAVERRVELGEVRGV